MNCRSRTLWSNTISRHERHVFHLKNIFIIIQGNYKSKLLKWLFQNVSEEQKLQEQKERCTKKQAVIVTVLLKACNVIVSVLVILNIPAINKQYSVMYLGPLDTCTQKKFRKICTAISLCILFLLYFKLESLIWFILQLLLFSKGITFMLIFPQFPTISVCHL